MAQKLNSLNLMSKFVEEKTAKNKEACIGSLSSFLRGMNYKSKREFVEARNGL